MSVEPPAPPSADETLDARVRRRDPDRWLSSRFIADPATRAEVVAVYALNDELAHVGETVTNPLAGEIRLAWWRERIEAIAGGAAPPSQPTLQALAPAIASGRAPAVLLDAMVEARHGELEPRPFADDAALARYLDGTAGAVMGLAARLLDAQASLRTVVEAARGWGLAGLLRARPAWLARGRDWAPQSWGDPDELALAVRVRAEVEAALTRASQELAALSVKAFPAVSYVCLAKPYAAGRRPGEVGRRLRLFSAALTGRIGP